MQNHEEENVKPVEEHDPHLLEAEAATATVFAEVGAKLMPFLKNGTFDEHGRPLLIIPITRDELGELVRQVWVRWARQQPDPKMSWLTPWAELDEVDKEADRQIGEAVLRFSLLITADVLKPFLGDVNIQFDGDVKWKLTPLGALRA